MHEPSSPASEQLSPEHVPIPEPKIQGPLINTSSETNRSSSSGAPTNEGEAGLDPNAEIKLGEEQLAEGFEWSQRRHERRQQGEWERAGVQLRELVSESLETPLHLNAIRIIGTKATRPSFLANLVAPYLPELPPASYLTSTPPPPGPNQSLRTVFGTARELGDVLSQFDIFSSVEASIEKSPSVLAEEDDVDIVLRVKETPRFFLRTATDIGDGEGNATGTARVRNAFGGGETAEGNVSFGTRTKSSFQLRFDTPVNASPVTRADFSISAAQRDLKYFASCTESTRGIQARIRTLSPIGNHELSYEATLRHLGGLSPSASISMREAAGDSVKSSVSHTFTRDTRNDPFLATSGSFLKLRQEFAGLGGDVNFVKAESESFISRSLTSGHSLSLGFRTGFLFPLGGKPTLFSDRYHLGGPTSVRMFRPNAMGPRDNGDYLGADLHWAAGVSLVSPFPARPDWPLKSHLFMNAGRLTSADPTHTPATNLHNLFSQPSVTAGVGLMYRHSLVRIEANVGVPLLAGAQEGTVKGFQFGLGLSFL